MIRLFCFMVTIIGLAGTTRAQFIVAHRGASAAAPENTLAAFKLAWQRGADAIEGDFYLSKDKQIVCIHDRNTKRTAPEQPVRDVADTTLEQLRTLDVGRWKAERFAGEKIPTLAEVLATVPKGKQIFVEVKCGPEIVPYLKPVLEDSDLTAEQIAIICFNRQVVAEVREQLPQYRVNWLTSYEQQQDGAWKPTPQQVIETLKACDATGLGSNGNLQVLNRPFVEKLGAAGYECHVWTINDPDVARRLSGLGVASITTDKPDTIRAVLEGS
jgi:glycerophosphoryl diester phosphodiesterase